MIEPPTVRRGERITARLWNKMAADIRSTRLIAGKGVRLRHTTNGTIISFQSAAATFQHPFQVTLAGVKEAIIRPGTVNRVEPTIKGVPLSGTDSKPAPVLQLGKLMLDKEGRGYICVEIACMKTDWAVETARIVQVADPHTESGEPSESPYHGGGSKPLPERRARHPIAMLRERPDGRLVVYQITFFHLQHRAALSADRTFATRHFFWQ